MAAKQYAVELIKGGRGGSVTFSVAGLSGRRRLTSMAILIYLLKWCPPLSDNVAWCSAKERVFDTAGFASLPQQL